MNVIYRIVEENRQVANTMKNPDCKYFRVQSTLSAPFITDEKSEIYYVDKFDYFYKKMPLMT